MKFIFFVSALFLLTTTAFSQLKPMRTGAHSFTIQWISFNKVKPGTVTIKPSNNGTYSIEGEQRDKNHNEYVTIKGTIEPIGRNLYFNGKIVSRITSINNGQPCELNGQAVFRASGQRKYWRLQQMLNCDSETTDYIDIFF
ncbi:hypothetical protein [Mucilaginibacter sp. PAMB04168]|uniref:hypothetical protein n=1 Tax=Mucilaginibacter sp. PAMB04168 TaxID=3138567 RepID=UPI0031F61C5E